MTDAPPMKDPTAFRWPAGKRAAVSLTFDDARLTQPDNGFAILDRHKVHATFYVTPSAVEKRLDAWKKAVANGHEIGNHTVTHPCAGGAAWTRPNALEDYTLDRITREIDDASAMLKTMLGVTPKTFAYPCSNTCFGRGRTHQSFVPLIAERFTIGRSGGGQAMPGFSDLAQLPSTGFDRMGFEQFRANVERARNEGNWLILTGHEIAADASKDNLTTFTTVLEEVCRYVNDPANEIWVDTVEAIGAYVRKARAN